MGKLKKKGVSKIILFIFAILGMVFSIYLVVNEIQNPGFCPLIFSIPACYLVLVSYILVFISIFINKNPGKLIIFYTGAFCGLGIAIWFSTGQIIGTKECPVLFNIPLCFGSAALFILIIVFGSIEIRKYFLKGG